MQRQVIFRDYQEQTASDHNNLQAHARDALDNLVKDAVTAARRYAGFTVTKTAQTEVQVAEGRLYDVEGAVYERETPLTQSMTAYLAAASKRIVAVSVFGSEVETDTQERDFLVNVATGITEPQAVSMERARQAQLVFTSGAENIDPQPPAVPITHVVIAHVLVDTTQVVSVAMLTDNRVQSNDDLGVRARALENFRDQILPRVNSLGSDLASLANALSTTTSRAVMVRLMEDVARVKEALRFPSNAAGYGADFFLLPDESDTANAAGLGYDAKVEEGVRFANANADEFEISLFSANDPNAALTNGLLLPKYSSELKLTTGAFHSDLGIAQYGFQTVTQKVGYMSRSRLRYGGSRTVCTNGSYWDTPGQPPALAGLYDYETEWLSIGSQAVTYIDPANPAHYSTRYDSWWQDTWKEPYFYAEVTESAITGALVAQSFLVSNDIWATKLGFYITAKGANENIHLTLCEVVNGVPNIERAIQTISYPHASIVTGWNRIDITPTFLAKGKRYALVAVSNANHRIGMASGQSYLDGTFFYSTDGQYFLGDLTKDMMLEVWGARFNSPQVAIEFAPINLDGGFRDIDILCEQWGPESTQLVWEIRPNGTGEWQPLVRDNAAILATAPPLAQFRARFVGTRDMMPAVKLTGSRVAVSRPKTAFKHVSTPLIVPSTTSVVVRVLLERFDDTPHDLTCKLRVGAADVLPSSTVTKLLDADAKRYERVFTFAPPATTQFRIVLEGATNSAQNTFHVAERTFYVT